MLDLVQLVPHAKKDAKLDTKSERQLINEVADMKARQQSLAKGLRPVFRNQLQPEANCP